MTDRGTVYDLGYAPHEGPRLGRRGAMSATIKDGIRRVLGLRRRARKKILPWGLFAVALLPAVAFIGLAFFLETFAPEFDSPFGGHSQYFGLAAPIMMIFTVFVGPELLIPDREEGVLAVYSSRPIRAADYLIARGTSLAIAIGGFLVVPQLFLYVGLAAIDTDGFAESLIEQWPDLWRIFATSVAFLVGYGALALVVSVYARRIATASGTLFGVLFGSFILLSILVESGSFTGSRYSAVFAFLQHPFVIRDWIWDQPSPDTIPANADFGPMMSLIVIALTAVAAGWLALRRYRRLM